MILRKIYNKAAEYKWAFLAMTAVAAPLTLTSDAPDPAVAEEQQTASNANETAIVLPPPEIDPDLLPTYVRNLTVGEKKMLHSLLGETVNLNEITIWSYYEIPEEDRATDEPENSNNIIINDRYFVEDYSKSATSEQFAVFIRHAVLLGQSRAGMDMPENSDLYDPAIYSYQLEQDKYLSSYDRFQQAAIIADYAQRFIHPAHGGVGRCEQDSALAAVVEREFNSAARYRTMLPPPRPMALFTAEEINLAEAIFGDEINVSNTQKHFSNRECDDAHAEYFENNKIVFYGAQRFENNYASTENIGNWGLFVHEVTHIWQAQNEIPRTTAVNDNQDEYSYRLEAGKSLTEYTTEQQGNIVRDYAFMYLHPMAKKYTYGQDRELLRTVVEDRLPQAAISRRTMEQAGHLPNDNMPQHLQRAPRSGR